MMKKLYFIIIIALLGTSALAQHKETRKVDDFDYVSFAVNGDLTIIQGSKTEVILEGDEDVLEEIETYVTGGKLKIKKEGNNWSWFGNSEKIKATVTLKDFAGVSVSGSGTAVSKGMLKGGDVRVSVSGSGEIMIDLQANDVECSVSGSGDIDLHGKGRTGAISISGSGDIDASDFETEAMTIKISGSGDAAVFATQEIESRISGSGSVRYKGDPDKVYNHSSGSGKLRKM